MEARQIRGNIRKPIIVLSHHQPLSSFEHAYDKPARQLADLGFLQEQDFIWLFGHEHRLAIYRKQRIAGSLTFHARCIGHGGMPVAVTKIDKPDGEVLYYDPRQHPIDEDNPETKVGYNGHVELIFDQNMLTIEYHDIVNNSVLMTETFTRNEGGGLDWTPTLPPASPLVECLILTSEPKYDCG